MLSKEVSYSEIFPDIYPAGHDHMMSVDIRKIYAENGLKSVLIDEEYEEEEKQMKLEKIDDVKEQTAALANEQSSKLLKVEITGTDKAIPPKQVSDELIIMDDDDGDDGSYSPPPPSMLDSDVFLKPPWDNLDEVEESKSSNFVVQHDMISPMNSKADKPDLLNTSNDSVFPMLYDDEDDMPANTQLNDQFSAAMILSDDLLKSDDDEPYDDGHIIIATAKNEYHIVSDSHTSTSSYIPTPKQFELFDRKTTGNSSFTSPHSAATSTRTMMRKTTPLGSFEPPIVKMQKFRNLHQEKKKAQDEEHGLSFNEQSGTLLSKPAQFGQYTVNIEDLEEISGDSDDSLVILQKEYQRELMLKDAFKEKLFDGNIDDHEDPHPKDQMIQILNGMNNIKTSNIKVKNDKRLLLLNNAYSETPTSGLRDKLDLDDSVAYSNSIQNVYSPSSFDANSEILPVHPIPIPIETKKSLKPSIAKKISPKNQEMNDKNDEDDKLFGIMDTDVLNSIALENAWNDAKQQIKSPPAGPMNEPPSPQTPQPSPFNQNPPQLSQIDIDRMHQSMNGHQATPIPSKKVKKFKKKKDKYSDFINLPPIPGVITLKKVKCKNLAKGKMSVSETYYLRVYQGECEDIETTSRHTSRKNSKASMLSTDLQLNDEQKQSKFAEKIKQLRSKQQRLPPNKASSSLPSLVVIKSYPVFAKKSDECVTWQNLSSAITRDAKTLTVAIYMKRDRESVLIGSASLAKNKKNLIPKPRAGVKTTSLMLTLNVPDKYKLMINGKCTMEIVYTFVPKQFGTDFRILQATKLPKYPSKIPVIAQLLRIHLSKIAQDEVMFVDDETDSVEDEEDEDEYEKEYDAGMDHQDDEKRFYQQSMKGMQAKKALNELIGNLNSGHFKLNKTENEIVWFGLLRWLREIQPNALLHVDNLDKEFVDKHNQISDAVFRMRVLSLLLEPNLSLFLWCIDFMIELCEWYQEKINIKNQIIDAFVPSLFGFDASQKHKLFLVSPNAFLFVIRILELRKKQQFK